MIYAVKHTILRSEMNLDTYEKRCEATSEIKAFLKEHPMTYIGLINYAREHNKKEWQRAIRSRGCWWLKKYCIGGYAH